MRERDLRTITKSVSFRARSRILSLLGDQLIGKDHLAIFELVKNAYDADASEAHVAITGLLDRNPTICVQDDGEGMDVETIATKWLEIGSDHRKKQREAGKRTPRFGRLPLGEKGVGRIACYKLGREIELITRRAGNSEFQVVQNWDELMNSEYLADTQVDVHQNARPIVFGDERTGTRITISGLRKLEWTRRDIRDLSRAVTGICSPFEEHGDFVALLEVPEYEEWLEDMPSAVDLMEFAPWRFSFALNVQSFSWNYSFVPPPSLTKKLAGRTDGEQESLLLLPHEREGQVTHDASLLEGIGSVSGEFVAYDGERKILNLYPQVRNLTNFLGSQAGIRVYRDGIRVYNYGEPGDDWLGLDLRRVQRPAERLSRNIVLGGVQLSLQDSTGLTEKTNREGFQENETFEKFSKTVLAIVEKFEMERVGDKRRLKTLVDQQKEMFEIPVEKPLSELRRKIIDTGEAEELIPLLDKVESDYEEMKDILLRAGMAGINLALVIHEVRRGVQALYDAIRAGVDAAELARNASELVRAFETISGLLQRGGSRRTDVRSLVRRMASRSICGRRFERHQVQVQYRLPEQNSELVVYGAFDLLLGTLTNLVDNALYWLRVRFADDDDDPGRRLFIGISDDFDSGPALLVGDNGPGFNADPYELIQPFVHKKPGGSGLGLYYASVAMQLCKGSVEFPERGDVDVPDWVDGAIVALVLTEERK